MKGNLIIALPSGIPIFTHLLKNGYVSNIKRESNYSACNERTILTTAILNALSLKEEAKTNKFYQYKVENELFLTYITDDLSVILSGVTSENTSFYKNKMRVIANLFIENYSSEIKPFNGNVDTFENFATILEKTKILNYKTNITLNNVKSKKASGFPVLSSRISLVHLFTTIAVAMIILMIVYISNQQQMLPEYLTNH